MSRNIWIPLLVVCGSCVDPFEPELTEPQKVVVISGMITDDPGIHSVTVSRSTPYSNPEFQPIEGCVVTVSNHRGSLIHYSDSGEGIYLADVPGSFLDTGDAASVSVITPDMQEYRSDYDNLLPCPRIDSVYYIPEFLETGDPDRNIPGIRFYLDMSGTSPESRDVLWRIVESWEYWAALIGNKIWWGDRFEDYRSSPLFRCWKEFSLDRFYLGTTRSLLSNRLQNVELHFVSNETDRLSITYSISVRQHSLSAESYEYWRRVNELAGGTGEYLEKQPSSVRGNIYNVNDADEVVLGYFYASQVREKRVFVHNYDRAVYDVPHIRCEYEPFSVIYEWDRIEFPVYIYHEGPFKPVYTGLPHCFDCRIQGGDTIKPPYWKTWYKR